jgi:hypothetical protein
MGRFLGSAPRKKSDPGAGCESSATSAVATVTVTTLGDFLNAPGLAWTTRGAAPWFMQTNVTHDGVGALRSGAIGDSQESVLEAIVTGPGSLGFWWKVSSEEVYSIC